MNEVAHRSSTAVAALQGLKTGLTNVAATIKTSATDPYLRLLTDGSWVYGAENIEVEPDSGWAVNPLSIMHGYTCWSDDPKAKTNENLGEVMVPATSPLPDVNSLPDHGYPWNQQVSLQLRCMDGEDAGEQVLYKTSSKGGMGETKKLIAAIIKQLDDDPDHIVPVVNLRNDHYQHKKYGKTYVPILQIEKWVSMDGLEEETAEQGPEPVKQQAKAEPAPKATAKTKAQSTPKVNPADAKAAARKLLEEQLAAMDADEPADEPATDEPPFDTDQTVAAEPAGRLRRRR